MSGSDEGFDSLETHGEPGDAARAAEVDGPDPREWLDRLLALIEPGPEGLFGERGLEGFVQEFLEGFRGDAERNEWRGVRRLRERFLTTAALGRLIASVRVHAERALQGLIAELAAEASPERPFIIDARFVREHGGLIGATLLGALANAIASHGSTTPGPTPERPRRVPYRIDAWSIVRETLATASAAGRELRGIVGMAAGRSLEFHAMGDLMTMAMGLLGAAEAAPAASLPEASEPDGDSVDWALEAASFGDDEDELQ